MNRFAVAHALILTAGLAVACSVDDMHGDDGSAGLRSDLSAARAEIAHHHETVLASPSLSEVITETDRHDRAMDDMMNQMGLTMGGMSHCTGSGMSRMHEQMTAMQQEMDAHRQSLSGLVDLPAARDACAVHTDAMTGMLDGMEQSIGDMGCM